MSNSFVNRVLATENGAGALALFAASLSLMFSGGGRLSVDRVITGER